MLDILYEDNHCIAVFKAARVLTAGDRTGDVSLLEMVKQYLKDKYRKPGNVYVGLVHRLDRPVSGVVLFARTSKALSRLNEQVRDQEIQRIYIAEVEGILPAKEGRLDHYLIHGDHRAVVATEKNKEAKHARLTYQVIRFLPHTTVVSIELETGRYHQIRAQFSATGHPVVGDKRYGAKSGDGEEIHLHCAKLAFEHPVTKEVQAFESPAPF